MVIESREDEWPRSGSYRPIFMSSHRQEKRYLVEEIC